MWGYFSYSLTLKDGVGVQLHPYKSFSLSKLPSLYFAQ
jgi:hypothetical protein